jgi:hypothetical protein
MAQIAAPYGLRVIKMLGDLPFSGGMHTLPLNANVTAGFFFGDPVGFAAGNPTVLTATPVASTLSANSPIGVFMGAEWIDPVRGFVNAQYLPANAISNGATKVRLKIADAPDLIMQIQANGSLSGNPSVVGLNAGLIITVGNTATGNSTIALDSASAAPGTAATLALKIYDFVYNAAPSPGASSMPGDPFTDVLVQWNMNVHRYNLPGGL